MDDTHREVKLLSNFSRRLQASLKYGILKGILWHQGEADAHSKTDCRSLPGKIWKTLFDKFRKITANDSLPLVVGKLGSFAVNQDSWDEINESIEAYGLSDEYCEVVETYDLEHKGDRIHFNAAAQRALGKTVRRNHVETD